MVAPQSSIVPGGVKAATQATRPRPSEVRQARRWSPPFTLGRLVGDSLAVMGHRIGAILGPGLLLSIAGVVLLEVATRATLSRGLGDLVNVDLGLTGVSLIALTGFVFLVVTIMIGVLLVSSLVTGAVALLAVADHRSKRMRLVTALKKSARRFLSLVGDSIITALCTLVPFVFFFAFVGIIIATQLWFLWEFALIVLAVSGALAILVFGAVSLAFPVTMVDHEDALRSVSVSMDMTHGHRRTLFGALLVLVFLPMGAVWLLAAYVAPPFDVLLLFLTIVCSLTGAASTVVPAVAYDLARQPTGPSSRWAHYRTS